MLVSLSPQSEKKGERMSSVMNYRRGGRLQEMITRTDPLIHIRSVSQNGVLGRCANRHTATGIGSIRKDHEKTPLHNLRGQRLSRPQKGINIWNGKKFHF